MGILNIIKHPIRMALSYISPKLLASIYYKNASSKRLNWKRPKDINEIINWLKFYSDTSLWTMMADKYAVRDFIKNKGLEHILTKLYGVWDNANDIDFDSLPNSFVLKTNHGSGTNIIVKDKSILDIDKTRKILNSWLKLRFGQETIEFHYLKIKPQIIAEELLEEKKNIFSSTIIDYKVWCLEGKAHHILTCYNRSNSSICLGIFNTNWTYCPEGSIFNEKYPNGGGFVPRPKCLNEMINAAETISKGHPQARVDFYVINDKLYFGEVTMTSQGGYMDYYTAEFLIEMGSHINMQRFLT